MKWTLKNEKTFNKRRWEEDSPSGSLSFIWENIFPASEQQFSSYLGHSNVSQHPSSCPSPKIRQSFFSSNRCSCMPITRQDMLTLQPWAGTWSALGECGRGDETVIPLVYFVITEGEFLEPRLQVTHGYSFKKFGIHCYQLRKGTRKKKDRKGRQKTRPQIVSENLERGIFGANLVMINSLVQVISGCGLMFGIVIKLAINSLIAMCWVHYLFTSSLILSHVQLFATPRTIAQQVPL